MNNSISDYMINTNYSTNDSKSTIFDLGGCQRYSGNMGYNNTDIESKLRNIRAINLEGEDFDPKLQSSHCILLII